MNYHYDTQDEAHRVAEARDSYSARLLTNGQFEEALANTHIIEREIKRSGSFKEKLGDYAHAFARMQGFDTMKGETILRDIYKARTGETMNQTREVLMEREEKVGDRMGEDAYRHATEIADLMEHGVKMCFRRAAAQKAETLAMEHGTTERFAYRKMAEEFEAAENMKLSDWGKELEEKFFRPQIEAEMAEREKAREQSQDRGNGRSDTGSATRTASRSNGYTRSRSRGPEMRR